MSFQRRVFTPFLVIPFLCCSPALEGARTVQQGALSIRVDALLGLDPLDVKAEALKRLDAGQNTPVRLALDVQLGGGVRGSLARAGIEVKGSRDRGDAWPALLDELVAASDLAAEARGDLARIKGLLSSAEEPHRIAGIALLGEADATTHKSFLQNLPRELSPNRIREIASALLSHDGQQNTLTLIALSQRYPALFDELLGAVAERNGDVAIAYLTAVSRGHEDEGARATAQAALEARP